MNHDEQSKAWQHLAALVSTHGTEAIMEAKKIIKDEYLAMDIVQDSIKKVLENWYKYDDSKLFWPWYKTIIKNMARNALKKTKREVLTEDYVIMNLPSTVFSTESSVHLINEDFWKIVSASLTPKQYSMVYHRYRKDMDYQQLAAVLNVSMGTVRRRLSDSHQKLRKVFDKKSM